MRPKKDPGIRQDAFVRAATELFMEKGYESVSVRDVLDAVADKTASPSVFYYYFSSKDALYRACVEAVAESYLKTLENAFPHDGKTIAEWMGGLVSAMETYLTGDQNLIATGDSAPNRLFILDMRDKVTSKMASLWSESLASIFAIPNDEAKGMARFLAGGIGEMLFAFMLEEEHTQEAVYKLTEEIVRFSSGTIGLPEYQIKQLIAALKEQHGRKEQ